MSTAGKNFQLCIEAVVGSPGRFYQAISLGIDLNETSGCFWLRTPNQSCVSCAESQ